MKAKFSVILFWSILLCFLSFKSHSQDHYLPDPQMAAGPGVPPPPGLVVPIDSKMILLAAAGGILGIYVLRPKALR